MQQILEAVAQATGTKVEGMGADQRVYGVFGPGLASEVILDLLLGSGYNVLLIGDRGQGVPRQIVLSLPPVGPPPVKSVQANMKEENAEKQNQEPAVPAHSAAELMERMRELRQAQQAAAPQQNRN